jgi:hypothetical protein
MPEDGAARPHAGREAEEDASLDALVMRPAQAVLPVLGLEGGEELLGQVARAKVTLDGFGRLVHSHRPLPAAVRGRRFGVGGG